MSCAPPELGDTDATVGGVTVTFSVTFSVTEPDEASYVDCPE
jgi:hypothetical protein